MTWVGVALFFGGWLLLSLIAAWGLSRWFRWVRGDFDRRA